MGVRGSMPIDCASTTREIIAVLFASGQIQNGGVEGGLRGEHVAGQSGPGFQFRQRLGEMGLAVADVLLIDGHQAQVLHVLIKVLLHLQHQVGLGEQ